VLHSGTLATPGTPNVKATFLGSDLHVARYQLLAKLEYDWHEAC
jgi:hypothetical protein